MRLLANLLAVGWALLVLAALFLAVGAPAGADPAQRAWLRIAQFLVWQGIALLVALLAAALGLRRHDPPFSRLWWMGWAPLFGSVVIGLFVAFAGLATHLL